MLDQTFSCQVFVRLLLFSGLTVPLRFKEPRALIRPLNCLSNQLFLECSGGFPLRGCFCTSLLEDHIYSNQPPREPPREHSACCVYPPQWGKTKCCRWAPSSSLGGINEGESSSRRPWLGGALLSGHRRAPVWKDWLPCWADRRRCGTTTSWAHYVITVDL